MPRHHIQDVQTRWNSNFYVLDRLLEQKKPVILYAGARLDNNDSLLDDDLQAVDVRNVF